MAKYENWEENTQNFDLAVKIGKFIEMIENTQKTVKNNKNNKKQ